MEDETPVIYGLEFQARALSAQTAETETVRFLVGTQSLKYENQIHCLEFDEENSLVNKNVYLHSAGEVWHLSASPTEASVFATCYNKVCQSSGKCEMRAALWKFPAALSTDQDFVGGEGPSSLPSLQKLTDLDTSDYGTDVKSILWHPSEGTKAASLVDNNILVWDLLESGSSAKLSSKYKADVKGSPKFTAGRWSPHQNYAVIGTAIDTAVRGWDIRSMQQAWAIENAHGQCVRELDFNPYQQYCLASCGDDCQTKFWDIRNPSAPLLSLSNHSHWVWSVRYNHFHDQLVLTSSSDSRVVLTRVASISSEPYNRYVEDEEANEHEVVQVQDAVIATYEEHEDSVYAAEWSTADPWIFASLSYDGRLVINKVPRAEKYRILL